MFTVNTKHTVHIINISLLHIHYTFIPIFVLCISTHSIIIIFVCEIKYYFMNDNLLNIFNSFFFYTIFINIIGGYIINVVG